MILLFDILFGGRLTVGHKTLTLVMVVRFHLPKKNDLLELVRRKPMLMTVETRQDSRAYQFSEGGSVTSVSGMRTTETEQTRSVVTGRRDDQKL